MNFKIIYCAKEVMCRKNTDRNSIFVKSILENNRIFGT